MPPRKKPAAKAEETSPKTEPVAEKAPTPAEPPTPAPFWTAKALDRDNVPVKECLVSINGVVHEGTAITAQECPEALFPGALVVRTNIYGSTALGLFVRIHNGRPEVRELNKSKASRHPFAHVHVLLTIGGQEVFQNTRALFRDTVP